VGGSTGTAAVVGSTGTAAVGSSTGTGTATCGSSTVGSATLGDSSSSFRLGQGPAMKKKLSQKTGKKHPN